jgi:hypothetical protein
MVGEEGVEPSRAINSTDFKSALSTIPALAHAMKKLEARMGVAPI